MEGTNPAVAINDIDERDVRMQDRLSEMLTDKSQAAGAVLGPREHGSVGSQFQKLHPDILTNSTGFLLSLSSPNLRRFCWFAAFGAASMSWCRLFGERPGANRLLVTESPPWSEENALQAVIALGKFGEAAATYAYEAW